MSKVLLLNPPGDVIRTGRWVRKSRAKQSWPPIWLAYATGLLESHGHLCSLIDASAHNLTGVETSKYVSLFDPDLIAFYWSYDTLEEDLLVAEHLAKKHSLVLVGPWSFCIPNLLEQTEHVRAMTYGEFDHTLLDIADNKDVSDIKGVYFKDHSGEITKTEQRPLVPSWELDKFPFVTDVYNRHLDIKWYRQTSFKYPFVDLFTARSCPYNCSYCVWPKAMQHGLAHRYRARSVDNVIEELRFIEDDLSFVKQVFFQDGTLINRRAEELSQAILSNELSTTWGCYSRADKSYEQLELMKQAGCRTMHVGYETPIPEYLEAINKDITLEQMEEFAKSVRKLKMWTSATFMIFPWMSDEEIKQTVEFAKEIKPTRMNLIQLQAYPNTPIVETIRVMRDLKGRCMQFEEMNEWEKYGFREFYIKNPWFWVQALTNPSEWKNVVSDAGGLLKYLNE
jgi:pyruvate-formate lyase-activating enzyme